jgi:hypothetical protein
MKSLIRLSRPVLLMVLVLALTSQACSISLFENPFPNFENPTPASPPGTAPTPLARAEVKFTVQLPEPLAQDEVLAISVLDEVTGLELNPTDYQLTMVDALSYEGTFPIPDKAVIKYRYVRRSAARILEDTNTDNTIRYRMAHVNGPIEVADTINSWTDKSANTISGSIFGTVTDQVTGSPLAEIMVTVGGVQALTDSAGRFSLTGLRAGRHNLVAFALDGGYQTFQQGAIVEGNKGTEVQLKMTSAPLVNVIFTVTVPSNTQAGAPVRIAGSLLQLGNTFSDQHGGLSTIADRMPLMTPMPDGRYSVSIFLPAGAYINYKYSLGDGFWNSEFNTAGQYVTRQMVVPSYNTTIEDTVQTWQTGPNSPILFEVVVPDSTPVEDVVYIQFNPFSWTEPIPMWKTNTNRWAYKLYGPLNIVGSFGYRYCRNAQCSSADDASTAGDNTRGKNITPSITAQDIKDIVNQWAWSQTQPPSLVQTDIPARGPEFVAGVELQSYYDPTVPAFMPSALQNVQAIGSNWAIIDPSWTYADNDPLIFAQQVGSDPFRNDVTESVASARALNMNVALFPQPRFPVDANLFWASAPRDQAWWDNWFNHYRAFAINFADLATNADAQALIIGGDWIAPALPTGKLANGTPSGVPADAEARWQAVLAEIRQHYHGLVLFALPYTNTDVTPPVSLLKNTDGWYLLWFARLSNQPNPDKASMTAEAGRLLDENIFPIQSQVNKPLIIGLSYPSSTHSATGCIPAPSGGCLDWTALNRPNADISTVNLDLTQQFDIYDALFNAVNGRTWVNGIVSRGYYPPVALQDKSASVHGKPAADLLWFWFPRLLGNVK